MSKPIRIAIYIYFASLFVYFGGGMIFYPKELKCATAYFVAPGNVEKACAKFREFE